MDNDRNSILAQTYPGRSGASFYGWRRTNVRSAACLLMVALLASGCQHPRPVPPPARLAPVLGSATHYLGTPLSGPQSYPAPALLKPENALAVEVTILSLDRMPAGGQPLAGTARLVTSLRGASAVLPTSRLTARARIAAVPGPADVARIFSNGGQPTTLLTARGAVPAGATAAFKAVEEFPRGDDATGRLWRRGVGVDVYRPPMPAAANATARDDPIDVALVMDDFGQPNRSDTTGETPAATPAPARTPQHELAVVELPAAPNAQTVAFAVPFRFDRWSGQAVVAMVTVGPGTNDPAHQQAVARCLADLQVSSAIAADRPSDVLAGGDEASSLRVALAALEKPDRRRSALIYLAEATGARLCGDASLVADDQTLARVAGEVFNKSSADPGSPEETALGWQLDQTWLLAMGELLGNAKLAPELSAVLATHVGEVGRHPSSIEEVGKAAHSQADFDSLLLAENTIFLADGSPSARARAFDWLEARGKAPGGYSPLDPPRQRREALERAALGLPPPATAPSTAPTIEPGATTRTIATEQVKTGPGATTEPIPAPATTTPTTQSGAATEPASVQPN